MVARRCSPPDAAKERGVGAEEDGRPWPQLDLGLRLRIGRGGVVGEEDDSGGGR